jgi:8-oxo-dGTP pyrophosphatase MutT (NUDIX family)
MRKGKKIVYAFILFNSRYVIFESLFFLLAPKSKRRLSLHKTPPSNFSPQAEIAAVLPFIAEKILLLQRSLKHSQANLWCAPGGKIEKDETPDLTAIRELKEETSIEINAHHLIFLGKFYVQYPNGDFIFHLFKLLLEPSNVAIKINHSEHQTYGIFSISEIYSLPLTPGLDTCIQLALRDAQ